MNPDPKPETEVRQVSIDPKGLREDALRRGVTATLYLFPYGPDSTIRQALLLNHERETVFQQYISAEQCRLVFGVDECGIYEQTTRRVGSIADLPAAGEVY